MVMEKYGEIAEFILKKGAQKGFDEIEVFIGREVNLLFQLIEGLVTTKVGEEIGVGIRASIGKKVGFVSISSVDRSVVEKTLDQLYSITNSRPEDPDFNGFADPKRSEFEGGIVDPKIENPNMDEIAEALKVSFDNIRHQENVEKAEFYLILNKSDFLIANSRGLIAMDSTAYAVSFAEIKGKKDSNEILASDYYLSRTYNLEKLIGVLDKTYEHLKALFGSKKLSEPFKGDLVIASKEVSSFLQRFIAYNFSALNIQEKRSKFVGKLGEMVASNILNIVDNPHDKFSPNAVGVDGEGVPTQRKYLIEGGVLKNFLYDVYTARREGKESSGNGVRDGYKSQPMPGPISIEIESKSNKKLDDLISEVKRGIVVRGYVMGSHMADVINGNFSLTSLMAFYAEDGEIKYPLKSVTITGNFFELLKNVVAIGSDMEYSFGGKYPSIVVRDIQFI